MRLTVISTYYNEDMFLRGLANTWELAPKGFEWLIVDDGSQLRPADAVIRTFSDKVRSHVRLFRIDEDYGFNSHGARNLGMLATRTHWNVMIDVDRHYGAGFFHFMGTRKLDPSHFYTFTFPQSRSKAWRGLMANTYCIDRELFWQTGGYDEELRGYHLGDEYFHKQLQLTAPESHLDYQFKVLRGAWDWKESEGIHQNAYDEASKTMLHPPERLWRPAVEKVVQRINDRLFKTKPTINFPWREVKV
jgi:glycosyltransferase involved in cell wall biosynthesis